MPGQNELEIVLKLVDEASGKLKEITTDVKKDTQVISKESEKASKSLRDGFKEAGKDLKEFRREMFAATAVIATIIASLKQWAKYNQDTAFAFDSLGYSIKRVTADLGSLFAPTLRAIANLMESIVPIISNVVQQLQALYTVLFEKISYGIQYLISFFAALKEGVGIFEAHKIAAADAARATEEMADSFKQSFERNLSGVDEITNKMRNMAKEYYLLKYQLANKDLMDQQTTLAASVNLLQTLQSMHKTVWGSIYDFMNMGLQKFTTGFGHTIASIATGSKKASEAFKELGMSMIEAIVEFVAQYAIQALIAAMIGTALTATTTAMATTIAAAWLPAAIFASIATAGGADAAGAAGFAAASASGIATGAATIAASKVINLGNITVSKSGGTGGGYAQGGWAGLQGPELAMLGERGPEYVIPNHQLGGVGSYTHIEVNNPVLTSREDIDTLTEEISRRLARETERR